MTAQTDLRSVPTLRDRLGRARLRARRYRDRSLKLAVILRTRRYREAFLTHRVAAAVEHEKVPFRRDIVSVIDVGASRGQFALVALARFRDLRMLACIEPLPEAFAALQQLLAAVPVARAYNVAAGERVESRQMHVTRTDTSSSLLHVTARQLEAFPDTEERSSRQVLVRPLDELLSDMPRPCLVKIDVQGFEHAVLRGASRILQSVDEALVECSFTELYAGQRLADDVIALLREADFGLAGVFGTAYGLDGTCLQADLLFRRVREKREAVGR